MLYWFKKSLTIQAHKNTENILRIGWLQQINTVIRSSFFFRCDVWLGLNLLYQLQTLKLSPRLNYCSSLYSGTPMASIARLQLIQNTAARFFCGAKQFYQITQILVSLNWLQVHYLLFIKMLALTFKSLGGTAPSYLSSLLIKYSPLKSLCSSNQFVLMIPRTKRRILWESCVCCVGS